MKKIYQFKKGSRTLCVEAETILEAKMRVQWLGYDGYKFERIKMVYNG